MDCSRERYAALGGQLEFHGAASHRHRVHHDAGQHVPRLGTGRVHVERVLAVTLLPHAYSRRGRTG
jgi:hypothetical protein